MLCLCIVLCSGSLVRVMSREFPYLKDIVNVVEDERFYPKIDVNKATKEELVRIPYIGEFTAESIIGYRTRNGPFGVIDDLMKVKGIRAKNFKRFAPYLKIK